MRKKKQNGEQPILQDGWFWVKLFVPLKGGHYHHSWEPARVEAGKVRLFRSGTPVPLDAPILKNALWSGPIQQPPLDDEHRTALALEQAADRRKSDTWRLRPKGEDEIEPGPVALAVADTIMEAFVSTVDSLRNYYRENAEHRIELVERMASLIEQALRRTSPIRQRSTKKR